MGEQLPIDDRLVQLEELFSHQQRLLGQLDEVVVALRREMESLQSQIEQHRLRLNWLAENTAVIDDAQDEKPPHY